MDKHSQSTERQFVARKHGASPRGVYNKVYGCWRNIKQRCHNPRNHAYKHYGARGIFLCDEWRSDFTTFLSAVGEPPTKLHTLERINNNRGYEPGNVRWATRAEQSANRRGNVRITIEGETKVLACWAQEYGLSRMTLVRRLARGMGPKEAIETPTQRWNSLKAVSFGNETHSLREWADITGIKYCTLWRRMRRGVELFRPGELSPT